MLNTDFFFSSTLVSRNILIKIILNKQTNFKNNSVNSKVIIIDFILEEKHIGESNQDLKHKCLGLLSGNLAKEFLQQ